METVEDFSTQASERVWAYPSRASQIRSDWAFYVCWRVLAAGRPLIMHIGRFCAGKSARSGCWDIWYARRIDVYGDNGSRGIEGR